MCRVDDWFCLWCKMEDESSIPHQKNKKPTNTREKSSLVVCRVDDQLCLLCKMEDESSVQLFIPCNSDASSSMDEMLIKPPPTILHQALLGEVFFILTSFFLEDVWHARNRYKFL